MVGRGCRPFTLHAETKARDRMLVHAVLDAREFVEQMLEVPVVVLV